MVITEGKLRLGVLRYMVYLDLMQDSVLGFHGKLENMNVPCILRFMSADEGE